MEDTEPGLRPTPVRARIDVLAVTGQLPPPLPRPSAAYNPDQRRRLIRELAAHERQVELVKLEIAEATRALDGALLLGSHADDALQTVLINLAEVERLIDENDAPRRLIEQHARLTRRREHAHSAVKEHRSRELWGRQRLANARRRLHFFQVRASEVRRKLGSVASLKR